MQSFSAIQCYTTARVLDRSCFQWPLMAVRSLRAEIPIKGGGSFLHLVLPRSLWSLSSYKYFMQFHNLSKSKESLVRFGKVCNWQDVGFLAFSYTIFHKNGAKSNKNSNKILISTVSVILRNARRTGRQFFSVHHQVFLRLTKQRSVRRRLAWLRIYLPVRVHGLS